jgi:hypothetical protein
VSDRLKEGKTVIFIYRLVATGRLGTSAAGLGAMQFAVDNCRGATNTGLYEQGSGSTIKATGPALHAGIPVRYERFSFFNAENGMGTNLHAHPAAVTASGIQFQRYYIS